MDSLLPSDPSSIDGYVIEGRLGSGGFGIVYAATSPDGRLVAVKVLRPELSDDLRLRERLAREADALSRVEGHRTAEIFEVVTEGDLVYLVMERVEGESLTDQVNDGGALSGPMLWFAATGLVQALQEIHAAGIVHRDLKPSNVMYGPDGVKVLDFGISVVADETSLTQTGAFVGTGAWMAPEMVLGNDITEKTDVYALGLVLAFIALGAHPFGEGRADALMYRILNTDPDLDGIPSPFIDAVSMCLQRDPDDRPSLDELAGFFGSNGEQQLSATSIVGSDTGGTRIVQSAATAVSSGANRRRNVLIGSAVAAVLAVVGVIVGVTVGGGGDSENNPPELAEVGDTQLQTDEVAFVEDDEATVEPVEAVVSEEPAVEEEQPTPESVTEETETVEAVEGPAEEEVAEEELEDDEEEPVEEEPVEEVAEPPTPTPVPPTPTPVPTRTVTMNLQVSVDLQESGPTYDGATMGLLGSDQLSVDIWVECNREVATNTYFARYETVYLSNSNQSEIVNYSFDFPPDEQSFCTTWVQYSTPSVPNTRLAYNLSKTINGSPVEKGFVTQCPIPAVGSGYNNSTQQVGSSFLPFESETGCSINMIMGAGYTATITYDANGGIGSHLNYLSGSTGGAPYTQSVGCCPFDIPTRDGFDFVNWNTAPDGSGTTFEQNGTIQIPAGTTTLYAQWE